MIRRRRRVVDETKFYEFLKEEIQENVRVAVSDLLLELRPLLLKGKSTNIKTTSITDKSQLHVSTSEIKRRWGKSRTTIIKRFKEYSIMPCGKYGKQNLYEIMDVVKVFGEPFI